MAKIIAVVSGKGGTGKSTVSAALSLSLAATGCRVLAVDLDAGLRSLDLLLDLSDRVVFDLGDVLSGRCLFEDAAVSHGQYADLKLLCPPADPSVSLDTVQAAELLRGAAQGFDYVILDLPAGLSLSVRMARELADLITVVTVPDRITVRDTRTTVDVLLAGCKKPCRLIINKVGKETMLAGGLADLDELLDEVGVQLFAVVPFDPFVNARGRKQLTQRVFDAMALRITGRYVPILIRSV